jgi:hypothetical protein
VTVCRSKIHCYTGIMVFFLLALALPSHAAERITPSFRVDAKPLPEVLPHVGLKAVLAEFLDPLDTGIGKTLAFLLWRETLTAISDQPGAGVILAHTLGDERLVEMLEQNYHLAAVQIAKEQRGRMVLWGVAIEEGGQVLVNTHLTLLTRTGNSDLSIQYVPELFEEEESPGRFEDIIQSPGGDIRLRPAITATIPRTRFNFGLVAVTRNDLQASKPAPTAGPTIGAGAPSAAVDSTAGNRHARGVVQAAARGQSLRLRKPLVCGCSPPEG